MANNYKVKRQEMDQSDSLSSSKWYEQAEFEPDMVETSDQADLDLIVDNLYLGSAKCSLNHDVLNIYEIKAVLNVTEKDTRGLLPSELEYLQIPLIDDVEADLCTHL